MPITHLCKNDSRDPFVFWFGALLPICAHNLRVVGGQRKEIFTSSVNYAYEQIGWVNISFTSVYLLQRINKLLRLSK